MLSNLLAAVTSFKLCKSYESLMKREVRADIMRVDRLKLDVVRRCPGVGGEMDWRNGF